MMDVQPKTLTHMTASKLYIVDQPARARSPWLQGVDGTQSVFDVTYIESHFTSTKRYNLWPQAHLHTQWSGNGSLGDETFDQFYKSTHPSLNTTLEQSDLINAAGSKLIDTIGVRVRLHRSPSLTDAILCQIGCDFDGSLAIWPIWLGAW
jgi:hypothetical protein